MDRNPKKQEAGVERGEAGAADLVAAVEQQGNPRLGDPSTPTKDTPRPSGGLVEPALLAVADAAEDGQAVALTVAAGAITARGIPVSRAKYLDKVIQVTATTAAARAIATDWKEKREELDEKREELLPRYRRYFEKIESAGDHGPRAIYFISPEVAHLSGVSGSPPGLAIALEKIDAWWYGDPRWQTPDGSGGWFFGAVVTSD